MRPFSERIRRKDLVAVAAVSTVVAVVFLALGMFWRSAVFALMSAAFWFQLWQAAKSQTTGAKGIDSKNSDD